LNAGALRCPERRRKIGLLAIIGFFVMGSQFTAAIAAAGLFIGGLVFIRALVKIGWAHRSIDTITERLFNKSPCRLDAALPDR